MASCCVAQMFTEESLDFQRRISQSNGLSEETYLAPSLEAFEQAYKLREERSAAGLPTSTPTEDTLKIMTMVAAREESSMVMFGCVQDVLDRCGVCIPLLSLTRCLAMSCPAG